MQIDDFLSRLKQVKGNGATWSALCPAHDDGNNSLSIGVGDKGIVIKCHAGCDTGKVVKALGLELRDLFFDQRMSVIPPRNHAHVHIRAEYSDEMEPEAEPKAPSLTIVQNHITLADYAAAKALPVAFLTDLGLLDRKHAGKSAVSIPYRGVDGQIMAIRYRIAMQGHRFLWRSGDKPQLYGLWRLDEARKAGHVAIVEGESDSHTAWYHNVPAVGIPGAANWRDDRDAHHLDGIEKIYVIVEPDAGGVAVLKWLSKSPIKDRAYLIKLGQYKDLSELHLAAGDQFDEIWQKAVAAAVPFAETEAKTAGVEQQRALDACRHLVDEPDILAKFSVAIAASGVVGETKTAMLIFLALISRFFSRPISIVVKGPSSAGKSFITERVLRFFPQDAYYPLTAMSDRALAYSEESLQHRFIIVYEAVGLQSDFATYLLRSLLSEGCVRYETVEKTSEGLKPRLIERKGPTGCILTTTAARLHPENETRMLSLNVSDSREQTRMILDRLAVETTENSVDFTAWHALQTHLKYANHDITIPYAKQLAAMVREIAVRLRRDFHHVLTLIRAHAMLHQASRGKDDKGGIVATIGDYAAVYNLIGSTIAEGVEATVRPEVRQTVGVVKSLLAGGRDSVTVKQVAEVLRLDASTVSRRVSVAQSLGYLKNEETRRRMPAKLTVGDMMPADDEVLPHPDRLRDSVQVCTSVEGDKRDTNSSEPMVEELV